MANPAEAVWPCREALAVPASPDVLIAHAWPSVRDGLVLLLADRRPALVVTAIDPADLNEVLPA